MKYLINCQNYKCKHYLEDRCFNTKKTICLNKNGKCESFEEGKHEGYYTCEDCKYFAKGYKHIKSQCGLFGGKKTLKDTNCNETCSMFEKNIKRGEIINEKSN